MIHNDYRIPMKPLTKDIVKDIWANIACGIQAGKGDGKTPTNLCVQQAVALATGEGLTDAPSCVAAPDRAHLVRLNDATWRTPAHRAAGLRRLAIMQLGTTGTDRREWVRAVVLGTVREVMSILLKERGMGKYASRCGAVTTLKEAQDIMRTIKPVFILAEGYTYQESRAYAAIRSAIYSATGYYSNNDNYDKYHSESGADAAAHAAALVAGCLCSSQPEVLETAVRVAEQAYEETGSPGLDLLRQIEGGEVRDGE